jgi:hypothetical protein
MTQARRPLIAVAAGAVLALSSAGTALACDGTGGSDPGTYPGTYPSSGSTTTTSSSSSTTTASTTRKARRHARRASVRF